MPTKADAPLLKRQELYNCVKIYKSNLTDILDELYRIEVGLLPQILILKLTEFLIWLPSTVSPKISFT